MLRASPYHDNATFWAISANASQTASSIKKTHGARLSVNDRKGPKANFHCSSAIIHINERPLFIECEAERLWVDGIDFKVKIRAFGDL
ncbi:hypothetical protein [Pelagovum sp. HNIBRBA483]|uniref:hypothetical protein n=1 Tax=Pelagovum sp. HNIBRBA483 TaxID=3233341 RepID=UPI0034A24586